MNGSSPSRAGYHYMALAVSELMRGHVRLAELRRAGLRVAVSADPGFLRVQAWPEGDAEGPTLQAVLVREGWWEPDDVMRARTLADGLAAELRGQWEQWERHAGGGEGAREG